MFNEKEVLNTKEIYLSDRDEILIPVPNRNVGYRYPRETLIWKPTKIWCSWKVYHKAITGEEALAIMKKWTKAAQRKSRKVNKAVEFASQKHAGQLRKGTTIPYIVHPLEVLQILYSMGADDKLLMAGVLHDTVEDTDTTYDEITELFGKEVACLVAANSEDKTKSWDERKQHTIDSLKKADDRVKMLIMADKLSNIRSIARDYEELGDKLWKRFNAPKEKQAWYYDGIQDALYDMQLIPECEKQYWEFVGLFKDVFVKYHLDKENDVIYQSCVTGEVWYLKKGNPTWKNPFDEIAEQISHSITKNDTNEPHFHNVNPISEAATLITRKEAELLEDIWNKPFWDCIDNDIQNGQYLLFSSDKRNIEFWITNGYVAMYCCDCGKDCNSINGKEEYNFC